MGIMDFFGKDDKPEPFKQDPVGEKEVFTPKNNLIRGAHGRFVSKKATSEKSNSKGQEKRKEKENKKTAASSSVKGPFEVMFFGKSIRKFVDKDKWFFSIDDILSLNVNPDFNGIKKKETYNDIEKQVTRRIINITVADKEGILKLIREVKGTFPGPLARWLEESSKMEIPPEENIDKIIN